MSKRNFNKLDLITGEGKSKLEDKKQKDVLPQVDTSKLKKKTGASDRKYHSFQMKKDIYNRLRKAAEEKDLAYTGDLVHSILETYLNENGY